MGLRRQKSTLFEKTAKAKKIDAQANISMPGKMHDPLRTAFDAFDKDKSGALSVSEFRSILARPGGGAPLTDEEVNEIISEFDTNEDGEIQFSEFEVMWRGGGKKAKDIDRTPQVEEVYVIAARIALKEALDVNSPQIRLLKPGERITVRERREFATVPPTLRALVAEPDTAPSVLGWINCEKNGKPTFELEAPASATEESLAA
mmetsp:Transcript_68131/g.135046  ORF Transcript_68131/g.135046 Transcript_68131/m.135046 type:complete len:204 (-) Transcript_68131:139-750(-)|eukprot:CAMPEP_0174726028 /NCGR_PEP_ID=MMETSP1094-20130205/46915_1 /TAXON_ID=156173 /ORGANISM="Chrysochromulina brevifilum, Strain UTEX LB 985" /LENGTH=203 /DNA_ID=CAMNT_0015927537 /DNA_START=113 /DNA_END=724 /DNA_ORIENTATION=+